MNQRTILLSALALSLLSACSDNNSGTSGNTDTGNTGGDNNGADNNANVEERSLKHLDNSDAFFSALREGLVRQSANRRGAGGEIDLDIADAETLAQPSTDAGTSDSVSAGESDGASVQTAPQSSNNSTTDDVTTTNVQEVGVDEQDRMKSDGEFLYILENQFGNVFPGEEPFIIDGTVPPSTDSQPAEPDDEFPIQLLPVTPPADVSPSVILPPQRSSTKIRILALQNDAPDAEPIVDLNLNLKGATADGMYLYKNDGKRNLIVTSTSFHNYLYEWNNSYAFNGSSSFISKLNVTDPTQASIEKTIKLDGQIVSSRRIGDNLFVASRYYPNLPGIDPYSLSQEDYQTAVESADLSTALPTLTTNGATPQALINPADCFVAAKGQANDYYYTPDIITLAVIDLNTLQLKDSECFLGASETLYATPNSIYLATTRWDYSDYPILELDDQVSTTLYVDPRVDTDIHQFSIDGAELTYSGSGVVSGHLGWNPNRMPFRLSEKDGYLRVATFSEAQNESVSPIIVSVLNVAGEGDLTKVATLPNANNPKHIGKPGEQLYASRYLGDRAYLVTFRQTDPLYVVDFSDPTNPTLAGELEIDGYSDYLHPIGEDYVLGIGKDAIPAPDGRGDGFGALAQGVKLSLFNVTDASNPTEVQSLVIGERGTEAIALQNHRAITIQRATDSHPTRIAFGIDVAGLSDPRPASNNPSASYPWNFTGLHGFDIKTGDDAGIEKRGVMVVNSAANPMLGFNRYNGDDRSVIVGDSVYYIHGSAVYAANWSDLSNFRGPK